MFGLKLLQVESSNELPGGQGFVPRCDVCLFAEAVKLYFLHEFNNFGLDGYLASVGG